MMTQLYNCFQHWSDRGTIWLYSDPHFDDKDMLDYFNYPNAQDQVKSINSVVGKMDTFICLGDVGNVDYIRQIKGHKVLITGNHDYGASKYGKKWTEFTFDKTKMGFKEAIAYLKKPCPYHKISGYDGDTLPDPAMRGKWLIFVDNCLFDEVYTGPLMIGEKLLLSHEPINQTYALNIHGHDHSGIAKDDYHINCCANKLNYKPISLNQLLKQGALHNIESIHRQTIDRATIRKEQRNG